jgi:hypothetical protein
MKFGVKVDLDPSFNRTQRELLGKFVESVMKDAQTIAGKKTPKRSGAAARAWKQQGTGTNTVVANDKPYIQRLDAGYSKQAPGGILKPTIREIKRKYR